jgi:outer membrane immunogenic protein
LLVLSAVGIYPAAQYARKVIDTFLGCGDNWAAMKRFIALTFVVLVSIGLLRIAFAGPERLSGKEMKEVAPAPPPCDWTGFYGGLHVGFGGGDVFWRDDDFGDNEILTHAVPIGVFGGAQLGYNRQINSWLVLGIEGEFEASDVSKLDQTVVSSQSSDEINKFDTRNNWNGTIGLRLGVTSFDNRLLAYVKGGAAFERWEYDWIHTELPAHNDKFGTSEWRTAPMVGFGLEYAFNCRWSTNIEYKHLFLGSKELTDTRIDDGSPEEESFRYDLHQDSVQVGINYKFWGFR